MKPKSSALFCFVLVLVLASGCATFDQRYKNLGNPTEYVFSTDEANVVAACKTMHGYSFGTYVRVYFHSKDEAGIYVLPHYEKRYWSGKELEDVEIPEAGKIGEVSGRLVIVISALENRTKVEVRVKQFHQEIGRKNVIFPHYHKVGVLKDVQSDTYFEYLFLHKLGELLGGKEHA